MIDEMAHDCYMNSYLYWEVSVSERRRPLVSGSFRAPWTFGRLFQAEDLMNDNQPRRHGLCPQ